MPHDLFSSSKSQQKLVLFFTFVSLVLKYSQNVHKIKYTRSNLEGKNKIKTVGSFFVCYFFVCKLLQTEWNKWVTAEVQLVK